MPKDQCACGADSVCDECGCCYTCCECDDDETDDDPFDDDEYQIPDDDE